jgi:hypothetical protein
VLQRQPAAHRARAVRLPHARRQELAEERQPPPRRPQPLHHQQEQLVRDAGVEVGQVGLHDEHGAVRRDGPREARLALHRRQHRQHSVVGVAVARLAAALVGDGGHEPLRLLLQALLRHQRGRRGDRLLREQRLVAGLHGPPLQQRLQHVPPAPADHLEEQRRDQVLVEVRPVLDARPHGAQRQAHLGPVPLVEVIEQDGDDAGVLVRLPLAADDGAGLLAQRRHRVGVAGHPLQHRRHLVARHRGEDAVLAVPLDRLAHRGQRRRERGEGRVEPGAVDGGGASNKSAPGSAGPSGAGSVTSGEGRTQSLSTVPKA